MTMTLPPITSMFVYRVLSRSKYIHVPQLTRTGMGTMTSKPDDQVQVCYA